LLHAPICKYQLIYNNFLKDDDTFFKETALSAFFFGWMCPCAREYLHQNKGNFTKLQ
jgi:hypothetical protein